MSEFPVTFLVQCEFSGQRQLEILLSGLCKGELGAYIEERAEPFGDRAEAVAERMLDDWDSRNSSPNFESFTKRETSMEFTMVSGYAIENDIAMLTELITLCGASVSHTPSYLVDREE